MTFGNHCRNFFSKMGGTSKREKREQRYLEVKELQRLETKEAGNGPIYGVSKLSNRIV